MCCFLKGENNGAYNHSCKDCLPYAKYFLMQLSVALSLHFGWGSQLNTSEKFWIDISRWMISSRCRWISVYLPWRTTHALKFNQSCNIVSSHNPVNCPAVICLPRIAVLSSFGRDITSERHGAPVHVPTIDHFAIYFPLLLLSAALSITITTCVLTLCKLQGRRD